MSKIIFSLLLFIFNWLYFAPVTLAEYQIPSTFTSCHNSSSEIKADHPIGQHAIVGVIGLQSGSDKVFTAGENNYTQCYCPSNGQTGVKTDWLAAGDISKEDRNVLITQGWVYIANGAGWGLSDQPYLAKNSEFSCNGGGDDGGNSSADSNTSSSGNSSSGSAGGTGGGEVLGISTLAGTSSAYSKYQILLTILLASFSILYGYKIQKNTR